MNRMKVLMWDELDKLVQFGAKAEINLLEIEEVADAHSHPRRVSNGQLTNATQLAWTELLRAARSSQEDVVHDGDLE